MLLLLASSALLVSASCGDRKAARQEALEPVGGAAPLRSLLDAAMRRADPQGAVLVVLWTTEQPPPKALEDLTKHWYRYGLIPIGVCLDLLPAADPAGTATPGSPEAPRSSTAGSGPAREEAIARVHAWQKTRPGRIRGLIYDGDPDVLSRILSRAKATPSVTLLSAQGAVLWSGDGYGGLDELGAILNVHLGEPSVARAGLRDGRPPGAGRNDSSAFS
jgi:hypothetical protein